MTLHFSDIDNMAMTAAAAAAAATDSMSEDSDSASLPDLSGQRAQSTTIPEEDEESPLVIMSDDAGQVYAPPPRLAARFYRDSKARRMSSNTSSRRNSISSSTHSHGSSRSFRRGSGCQSNYIAQHLRRASIIESRKARLADLAAHREQVRLRAALAKATPRGDANASEERALAAQVAREKYLAKVAATCAEEVAKAKQKAQEMKARKLEEEKRVRMEMEERLADAEKRRALYQQNLQARRNRRAGSQEKKVRVTDDDTDADSEASVLPSDVIAMALKDKGDVLDDDTAARKIQRTWRTKQRKAVVDAYMDLDLTLAGIRQREFEDIGALIAEARSIDATTKMLKFYNLADDEDSKQAAADTKTFLTAYLVATHPKAVLSKMGTQEQDLIQKAQELIVLFESATSRLAPWNCFTPSPLQSDDLSQSYTTYTSAFNAWRAQDSSALVETMVASFVELDAIWQTVKDDTAGVVAEDYRQGIRDNQVMLLSRIRKLAGADRADFLIKKSIRESRRRRGKKRSPAEVRPRAAESDSGTATPVASTADASHALPHIVSPDEPEQTSEEDANVSMARLFSPIPSNRILTHELAIDKDFRIPQSAHSDVRDVVNRALCDSMRRAFEQGQGTLWTVAMAQEIRGKLTRIVKPEHALHAVIVENLDLDLILNQCEQGIFSYANFFSFMASILPKLCAPFRDDEVKTLAEDLELGDNSDTGAMIEKLFRLLHFIDLLSLDYSNFLLMNAAPVLIRESAGYETRAFAADLAAGKITLASTNRWWRNACVNMLTEADRRDPEQVRNPVDRPTAPAIYSRGLVDLAINQGPLSASDIPETLHLDEERLRTIRQKALQVTTIGAILLVAKNLLKRDVRSAWKAEASRLWDLLSKEPTPLSLSGTSPESSPDLTAAATALSTRAFAILTSSHNLPPSTKSTLQSTVSRLITQSLTTRLSDPVARVLFARLRSHILLRVAAESSSERVRAASSASESLASAGLPEFVGLVGEMVEGLRRVAEVDWRAHGAWYGEVAREVRDLGVPAQEEAEGRDGGGA